MKPKKQSRGQVFTRPRPGHEQRLFWWGLVTVVALAFILRLAWVLNVHTYPISDFGWYHERALGLIHGQGYSVNGKPTAYWPIGYPLFLAGLYKFFGPHFYAAKAANVILGSLTVGLTYLLGNRLAGFGTGLLAGLLLAIMPSQIEWTSVLCSEILFTFLLTAIYLLVVKRPEHQGWYYPATSGLLLGAATLARATTIALPVGTFMIYWMFGRNLRRSLSRTAIFVLGMALAISPMTIRNYMIFHAFIPVSTNGGINFWMGNNPNATGNYYWPDDPKQNPLTPYLKDEVKRDQVATQLAMQFIRQNPGKFTQLLGVKFRKFYQSDTNAYLFSLTPTHPPLSERIKDRITDIANRYYRILMVLAIAGAAVCVLWRRWARDWPTLVALVGVILYFTAIHSIMPSWDRYRFPIMPLFAVLAGCALAAVAALGQRLAWPNRSRAEPGR